MHKNISGGINMLSIHLDQRSGKPLYNQIYEQIREQILTGELTASTKLPSTRSMAGNLGVYIKKLMKQCIRARRWKAAV